MCVYIYIYTPVFIGYLLSLTKFFNFTFSYDLKILSNFCFDFLSLNVIFEAN